MYEKSLYIHLSDFQKILYTALNIGYCMALECSSRIQITNCRSDKPWERENKSYFPLAALYISSRVRCPYFHPLAKWSSTYEKISYLGLLLLIYINKKPSQYQFSLLVTTGEFSPEVEIMPFSHGIQIPSSLHCLCSCELSIINKKKTSVLVLCHKQMETKKLSPNPNPWS